MSIIYYGIGIKQFPKGVARDIEKVRRAMGNRFSTAHPISEGSRDSIGGLMDIILELNDRIVKLEKQNKKTKK